jgi:uncharacterized LabA/DUF88 family protein
MIGRLRASLSYFRAMADFERACIFVDGENLRHSIVELFPQFKRDDYLPKTAKWEDFFNSLVAIARADIRLRTYWYVVDEIDFWPYQIARLEREDPPTLETILRKDRYWVSKLDGVAGPKISLHDAVVTLQQREHSMKRRFDGWKQLQNGIAESHDAVEFRRAGAIRYNLFHQSFGQEKGVDVKLATDMLVLNDNYDVGIVVSGDADYVPVVQAVKDWGKHIINVSFLKRGGGLLPGGARRLNRMADRSIEVEYDRMLGFMNLPASQVSPSAVNASLGIVS